jgi:HEAT repeat protein
MSRSRWRALEAKLERLDAVRANPGSERSSDLLREALGDKNSLLVARAAKLVADLELPGLEDHLLSAFDRFLEDPVKRDGGCQAKTAIVDALRCTGYGDPEVFLRGIKYVQMEPAYGGSVDTAVDLRCLAALGLVGADEPEMMIELARLLADPEARARIGAVRAMASSGRGDAVPVLYYKVLIEDEEPAVTGECFEALLQLAPQSSLHFVAGFLGNRDPQIGEAAALALGESRIPEAYGLLRAALDDVRTAGVRSTLLLAIAMTRTEEAVELLMGLIREGSRDRAVGAISALGIYRYDDDLVQQVREAAEGRRDLDLSKHVDEAFGS